MHGNQTDWPGRPKSPDQPDRPGRPGWPAKYSHQIEGRCENCQTWEIANLQFRWVSKCSARDASAIENKCNLIQYLLLHFNMSHENAFLKSYIFNFIDIKLRNETLCSSFDPTMYVKKTIHPLATRWQSFPWAKTFVLIIGFGCHSIRHLI